MNNQWIALAWFGAFLTASAAVPASAETPSSAAGIIGQGTLSDGEGHEGTWQVDAAAQGNNLVGTLLVRIAGRDLQLDLGAAGSYRENGRCYIRGESGRDRIELAASCDAQPFAGSVRGSLAGTGTISGQFSGSLAAKGAAARAMPAQPERIAASPRSTLPGPSTAAAVKKVNVNPNSGPFTGAGSLSDHDGGRGEWKVRGNLSGGLITGELSVTDGDRAMTVDLRQGRAYFENGFCVLKGVNGRNRFQLRGRCDQQPFAGTLNGYFDRVGEVNGEFSGSLTWGSAPAQAANGVLPKARLTCSYMERMGGVVAGDLGNREIRPSALDSLMLVGNQYQARNGSGSFVKDGNKIRLQSGPWKGAVGTLMADGSGSPAVYFELDDNRRSDGSYIVDPWRTFCTARR